MRESFGAHWDKYELKESLLAREPIRKFVCNGPIYQLLKSLSMESLFGKGTNKKVRVQWSNRSTLEELSMDVNILSSEIRPSNPPKKARKSGEILLDPLAAGAGTALSNDSGEIELHPSDPSFTERR